jgi:hypothetical protein
LATAQEAIRPSRGQAIAAWVRKHRFEIALVAPMLFIDRTGYTVDPDENMTPQFFQHVEMSQPMMHHLFCLSHYSIPPCDLYKKYFLTIGFIVNDHP